MQHKSEQAFAAFLDRHRIRWEYEPHTFILARNGNTGATERGFTPDFYLPEQNLYVEITTMAQKNVTRKHQKMRLLSELYPHIRAVLLYRRDIEKLGGDRELEVLDAVLQS